MRNVTASTSDVGLRQVVEDALQLLQGGELEDDRREFVISDLKDLFESASRGSELADEESLFFGADDISAYESFSFVEQHVRREFDGALRERLSEISKVFTKLYGTEAILKEEKEKSIEFLTVFLRKIEKEPSIFVLQEHDIFKVA